MKVLSYSVYDDIGGFGYRQAHAFNTLRPDWTYRAVRGAPSYLQFPEHTPWDWSSILDYWNDADVIHLHDNVQQIANKKPLVVTFHGTGFRESPAAHLVLAGTHNATVLVSTLDLWLLAPNDTIWAPQTDDLDQLATYRQPQDGPLRICHAPTNRALKSTDAFLTACERLSHDIPLEVVLIEGKPWAEALAIKGTCDVLFDQTAFGYGGNAIEAWGMGIPVVCGAPDTTLGEYERRFGSLPFVLTDPTAVSIYDALLTLTTPEARTHWGTVGRTHAQAHHSMQAGVERLTPIYEEHHAVGT